MEQANEAKFSCGGCGRIFRWKPAIAGKKAKCSCGNTVSIPSTEQAAFSASLLQSDKPKAVPRTVIPSPVKMAARATNVASPKPIAPSPIAPKPLPPKPAAPKLPPPPVAPEDDYGSYDLADDAAGLLPSADALAAASAARIAQTPVPVAALEYQRAPKAPRVPRSGQINPNTGELSDPMREYIVPLILLASGIGLMVMSIMRSTTNTVVAAVVATVLVSVVLGVTLVKTAVLVLASFPLATYCDVGLGLLRTAILKLAGVILVTDTVFVLIDDFRQKAAGATRYHFDFESWLLYVFIQIVFYHFSFWYLFRTPLGNASFAVMMALASRLFNIVMAVVMVGIIAGIVGAAAARQGNANPQAVFMAQNVPAIRQPLPQVNLLPPAMPIAPAGASNSSVATQPGQAVSSTPTAPTSLDTLISQRIKIPQYHVREAYDWARGNSDQEAKKLISQMYGAGAGKVYVDGFRCYVLLPSDDAKRAACLDVSRSYRKETGQGDAPADMTNNYQYIVLNLLPTLIRH